MTLAFISSNLKSLMTICRTLTVFLLLCICSLKAETLSPLDLQESLMRDLLTVEAINQRLNDRLPVTTNMYLQGGYILMPSARMPCMGELGIGYAAVPPYRVWSARCQPFTHLEITGNYRIFTGVEDQVLSSHGFGDFSDKGVNLKFALFLPEDSDYKLPGLAFGFDDILGTRAFKAQYLVLTQVFLDLDFECSFGMGVQRLNHLFGGLQWMPFRRWECSWLNPLTVVLEIDGTNYKHDPHPDGRHTLSRVNLGFKYRLWDYFDFSVASIRGNELSWMASASYNFGETGGFVPKFDDPLPYSAPVVTEPINCIRPEEIMVQELVFAFQEQGFDLLEAHLEYTEENRRLLRITTLNCIYFDECDVRDRLNAILAALLPANIDDVIVTIEDMGMPLQEYYFEGDFLRMYAGKEISKYELDLLSPLCEASYPDPCRATQLYKKDKELICWELLPKTQTFFGSSAGKFKYALGLNAGIEGFFPNNVYYQFMLGWTPLGNIHHIQSIDLLNPSQLINVRTDYVDYYKQKCITVDKAFLQKDWNMGCGVFTRLSFGYFDQAYGGISAEALYYPVNSCWAIGLEGACLKRRTLTGVGFTSKIRKNKGYMPTWVHFLGSQYFVDFYYNLDEVMLDFKVSAGKFLANDWGVRTEVSRNFESGLKLSFWYTVTNGHDHINGSIYYDKGFSISMPLDIFYTCSCREKWKYGMSAWLRDVGYRAPSGLRLYETVRDQRIY